MSRFRFTALTLLLAFDPGAIAGAQSKFLTAEDIAEWPSPPTEHRIPYGNDPLQFGELRLPEGPGPHPVAVVVHGGCWLARWDIQHIGRLAQALTDAGLATWTLEYRRIGNPGGGWPGTFQDIAHGADHLLTLAKDHALDLNRVLAVGHSAGGQFVLWLAARHRIPEGSPLHSKDALRLRGALALAAAPDLALAHRKGVCDNVIDKLMGGSPEEVPDRYRQGSPIEMIPLGVPQILVNGAHDLPRRLAAVEGYAQAARDAGDSVQVITAEDSAHFEVIAPDSSTWPMVRDAALSLVGLVRASTEKASVAPGKDLISPMNSPVSGNNGSRPSSNPVWSAPPDGQNDLASGPLEHAQVTHPTEPA
ncbi:MAG: alpha/beta hydrolase family protein [Acidobacteriota bacterium]